MQTPHKRGSIRARSDARGAGPRRRRAFLGKAVKWAKKQWGGGPSMNGLKSSVKGTVHTVGNIADNKYVQAALAAGLAATGVGAPAAAGIMAGVSGGGALAKKGGNIGDALKGAATGAVTGYGAGKLGSAIKGAGGLRQAVSSPKTLFSMGSAVKKAMPGQGPGGTPVFNEDAGDGAAGGDGFDWKDLVFGDGGDGKGSFGMLGDFMGNHGDKLVTGGAVLANYLDNKANRETRERAMRYAEDSFNNRAPLREAGMAGALNPERPDLSAIFANPGNPYARGQSASAPATAATPAAGGRAPIQRLIQRMGTQDQMLKKFGRVGGSPAGGVA